MRINQRARTRVLMLNLSLVVIVSCGNSALHAQAVEASTEKLAWKHQTAGQP